jgi:hypothetical protein
MSACRPRRVSRPHLSPTRSTLTFSRPAHRHPALALACLGSAFYTSTYAVRLQFGLFSSGRTPNSDPCLFSSSPPYYLLYLPRSVRDIELGLASWGTVAVATRVARPLLGRENGSGVCARRLVESRLGLGRGGHLGAEPSTSNLVGRPIGVSDCPGAVVYKRWST